MKCKECMLYHKSNNTCQSKKCAGVNDGKITLFDKLFCTPYKNSEDKHFYYDDKSGFFKCKKTDKDIRYPLIDFDNHLDFCPRCGEKIISHEIDWDWSDKKK